MRHEKEGVQKEAFAPTRCWTAETYRFRLSTRARQKRRKKKKLPRPHAAGQQRRVRHKIQK
jgi:hypothetical protein